jgi:hypothetical protein
MTAMHTVFANKLASMRSAAPRADLHIWIACGAWILYGPQAQAVHKLCPKLVKLKTFEAEDVLDDPAYCAEVTLENLPQFFEAVRGHHSIALVDVMPGDKTYMARHMLALFLPKGGAVAVEQPAPVVPATVAAEPEGDDFW